MKTKIFLLVIFSVSVKVSAQVNYQIGSSTVSIEPDTSVFSVAMAGYAAPRDGRFTITWKEVAQVPELIALTALKGKLYAVNNKNDLLQGAISDLHISWEKLGSAEDIVAISGLDGKLYGVNSKDQLLVKKLSKDRSSWKKIGSAENVVAMTGLDGKLYATNSMNELIVRSRRGKNDWKKLGAAEEVLSLSSNGNMLYAINSNNTMWKRKAIASDDSWIKIGRYNDFTYKIKVKHLSVVNNRLYSISDDGKLYRAEHSTKGDLSARALAIKDKEETVVIVGVDLCSFNYTLISDIKNIIYQRRKIPPAAILINASHTHFAPAMKEAFSYEPFMQLPDSSYLNNVVKKGIVKAIELALDNMSPADLYFGRGTTDIGYNRSSGNGQPYDNSVDVIKAVTTDKKNSSALFLTGCHPVFRNFGKEGFTMSANYPGVTRELLEDKANTDNAIFIQGCGGDINPKDSDYEKTGMTLALDIISVLNSSMETIAGDISYALDTVPIPIKPWSMEEIKKFKNANSNKEDIESEKNVRWADVMLKKYKEGTVPEVWPVYIQTLNIGNWKLVGLSREAVTEYGLAIKNLWPDNHVSVAGYTNGVPSYLPKDWHIKSKAYEGYNSFFWNTQPAILPINVFDIVIDKIKYLNK